MFVCVCFVVVFLRPIQLFLDILFPSQFIPTNLSWSAKFKIWKRVRLEIGY